MRAFPVPAQYSLSDKGMTLRDYFAAKALQGSIAGAMADGASLAAGDCEVLAAVAYRFADAMLAERTK